MVDCFATYFARNVMQMLNTALAHGTIRNLRWRCLQVLSGIIHHRMNLSLARNRWQQFQNPVSKILNFITLYNTAVYIAEDEHKLICP